MWRRSPGPTRTTAVDGDLRGVDGDWTGDGDLTGVDGVNRGQRGWPPSAAAARLGGCRPRRGAPSSGPAAGPPSARRPTSAAYRALSRIVDGISCNAVSRPGE